MKILKNNMLNNEWPRKVICQECGSELEIEYEDVVIDQNRSYYYCPVCNCENDIHSCDEQKITIDNLRFPDDFFSFRNGVDLSNEEIKVCIIESVKHLRNHPDKESWCISSGNTFVEVWNCVDDGEYHIFVAKDYYDCCVEYNQKDYDVYYINGVKL